MINLKEQKKAATICNVENFYIFLFLIFVETTGLLLLKNGLERGYLDTGAIILAVFHLLLTTLCSFGWVYFTIKKHKKINRDKLEANTSDFFV